ncbi:7-carboxy-7-deazaguanine synthase QueE [Roseibacillus ishigakijimensis]|uniref:7-carboxy-7-deazaguanine synthase n=1 Tax=Roseibacillus ishigakijimensis TaxID=454146 RepID=A0A934RRB0_9BACT|nr:7-carboxy-7-deazaguanine synthase QueE [Roseibacillus ishigakijimensis]MBK1834477.1 7-carboxy-7-deazaguanine synthase QueE [Roseibacillus ishigakijimensis]
MKLARFAHGEPEIFRTLQGEGPSLGCPAVFLRLSLCNLHCHWCDTPFTWNWEGTPWAHQDEHKFSKEEQIVELSPEEVAHQLSDHLQPGDRLVLTGGEPLLQQSELFSLLQLLSAKEQVVEIETNGTQLPTQELDACISQYNVSPKLSNSRNSKSLREKATALEFYASCNRAYFKFVVQSRDDLEEVKNLQERYRIPKDRLLLMPEGRSPEALQNNRLWLAEECLRHGYRLTDRLHVLLWGDERGK